MAKNSVIKKAAAQLVYDKIESALVELKTGVKEKKYEKHLKHASKLIGNDIAKVVEKSIEKKELANKKLKKAKILSDNKKVTAAKKSSTGSSKKKSKVINKKATVVSKAVPIKKESRNKTSKITVIKNAAKADNTTSSDAQA